MKDSEWCGDMGPIGASCYHTLTKETRDIAKSEWDKERVGMVCTDADNLVNLQAALEKLCHTVEICDYETLKLIENLKPKIEALRTGPVQENGEL